MPIASTSAVSLRADAEPASSHRAEQPNNQNQSHGGIAAALHYLPQLTAGSFEQCWLLDCELRVLFAHRAVDANNDPVIAVGRHYIDLLPPHSREMALSCLRAVLQNNRPDCFEITRAVGAEKHLPPAKQATRRQEVRVAPVREQHLIVGLSLHVTDITQHVLAQRTVAMQAKIIESMLEGVALINDRGEIVIANPAFEALFGFERGVLAGWPLEQLAFAAEFDIECLPVDDDAQPLRGAGPWPVEFAAQRQDGACITLAGAVSRLRDGLGEHRLLVLQDVSERKLLERAMLEAVSHEQYRIGNDLHDGVGQELTGIALMLRCLAGRLAAEHRTALPDVENITRLVNNAVESTRSLARGLSPVNLERGGLRDALAGLAMHARGVYGVKTVFVNRLSSGITLDAGLANHLYRIAQEAVTNAVKHGRAQSLRLQLSSARRRVRLVIADDGTGMPADIQSATGLGVRIMSYRARMVHGDLRFESVLPTGTRVVCECPIDQPALPRSGQRVSKRMPASSGGKAVKASAKPRAGRQRARIVKIR